MVRWRRAGGDDEESGQAFAPRSIWKIQPLQGKTRGMDIPLLPGRCEGWCDGGVFGWLPHTSDVRTHMMNLTWPKKCALKSNACADCAPCRETAHLYKESIPQQCDECLEQVKDPPPPRVHENVVENVVCGVMCTSCDVLHSMCL